MKCPKSWSRPSRCASNHRMCSWSLGRRRLVAVWYRFFLGGHHVHELASSGDQRPQFLSLGGGQRPGGWPHRLGKVREDVGVQGVGLGELPSSSGEVPHLPGIHHGHRQVGAGQFSRQGHLYPTGGFQHDQPGRHVLKTFHQSADAPGVVGNLPGLTGRPHRHIQAVLGHINANKHWGLRLHSSPSSNDGSPASGPTLPHSGSPPAQLFGLRAGRDVTTLLSHGVQDTSGEPVCHVRV